MLSGLQASPSRPIVRYNFKTPSMGQRKNFSTSPNPPRQRTNMMPLPNIANGKACQCTANNRKTGNRCLNPAAFGMATCRYHGARKRITVRQGAQHPQYQHGMETLDAKKIRRDFYQKLIKYENELRIAGLI